MDGQTEVCQQVAEKPAVDERPKIRVAVLGPAGTGKNTVCDILSHMTAHVYVAGPYEQPDPVENTAEAIANGHFLRSLGMCAVVPHLSLFEHFQTAESREYWLNAGLDRLAACDAMIRLPGKSSGADAEEEFADKAGIPVYFWPDEKPRFLREIPCRLRYTLSTSEYFLKHVALDFRVQPWDAKSESWRLKLSKAIDAYNRSDGSGTRLYREMIEQGGHDVLNGIRQARELQACIDQGLVTDILWLEPSKNCVPPVVLSPDPTFCWQDMRRGILKAGFVPIETFNTNWPFGLQAQLRRWFRSKFRIDREAPRKESA